MSLRGVETGTRERNLKVLINDMLETSGNKDAQLKSGKANTLKSKEILKIILARGSR